ncbi:MAG: 16S rRNA (adenine(1518)-N(6)/adenine(1519)-N(6))-dimethyltransferase RsmA [Patescibacteria group bacterium]
MDLTNKSELLEYLKKNNLWAKKGLGQNFLVDKNALDQIVEAAELTSPQPSPSEGEGELVVEVGPGVGTLTLELIKQAGEVVAVEMDEKLAELLKRQLCHSRSSRESTIVDPRLRGDDNDKLKIVCSDILSVNLNELVGDRKYKVVANIPYYITSKIIELFLTAENKPESIVLLVQKEVAERICAKAGGMSVLSVSVQLYGKPEIVGIVPKESFFPSPKVDSAILKISDIQDPFDSLSLAQDDTRNLSKSFFRCVHIGFASRRKTLVNNLSAGYHIDKKKASDIINAIGLSDSVRAQELSIEDWEKLAQKMNHEVGS